MDKGVHIDYREAEQTTLANVLDRYEREILPSKKSQIPVKGLNIMEASSITGHKGLRMLKRYTHLKAENLVHKLQ